MTYNVNFLVKSEMKPSGNLAGATVYGVLWGYSNLQIILLTADG